MLKIVRTILVLSLAVLWIGCTCIPGGTDLGAVAKAEKMINVTTGDGTFEKYTATGHYTGKEIGIAVGLPFIGKFLELYPVYTNEDLLGDVAAMAGDDGANAMINVTPHLEFYSGFPFGIVGLYVDCAEGTGIRTK